MARARSGDEPGSAGPGKREETWQRLGTETFDVVVIGGGVVGAGTALDAATRGLRVALVEARDLASGTSSRSSKLFHGGLRYLEQLEFGLVREALRERELMLTPLAPHLVKPVSFLYPLTPPRLGAAVHRGRPADVRHDGRRQVGVPGQKHLTRAGALRMVPGAQAVRADRRHPLLRRAGRRRPPHHDRRPHRRALRRRRADVDPGHRLPAGGRPGVRRAGARRRGRPGDRDQGRRR